MKAPDKIFLSVEKGEDWAHAMWTQKDPKEQKFSEFDKHEEYIRKDALLEWINEKRIEFLPGNDDISGVKAHSHLTRSILLDSFEQKINSL